MSIRKMIRNYASGIRQNGQLSVVTILALVLAAGWLAHFIYGHAFVKALYEGRSTGCFNNIIEGQAVHTLGYYYEKADIFFFIYSSYAVIISLFLILPLVWLCATRGKAAMLPEGAALVPFDLRGIIKTSRGMVAANAGFVLLCIALFLLFFSLYWSIGNSLAHTGALSEYDILFEMDTPRAIDDIAVFSADHYRTNVHPLYVLFTNPPGMLFHYLLNSKVGAAIVINSSFGACAVSLTSVLLWLRNRNYMSVLLLSSGFGLSTTQIALSSIPETYILASCSLIVTYILFWINLQRKELYFVWWVIAGIFTLGVSSTNFIQTLFCYSLVIYAMTKKSANRLRSSVSLLYRFIVAVFFSVIALSLVQKVIYPASSLFFVPQAYFEEISYTSLFIARHPFTVLPQIFLQFFLVNVVAPLPRIFSMSERTLPAITFEHFQNYTFIGAAAAMVWLCLLCWCILKNASRKENNDYFLPGISLCVLWNIVLHSFYGVRDNGKLEYFNVSSAVTCLVWALFSGSAVPGKKGIKIALAILVFLMGYNNISVMKHIIDLYR